MDHKLLRLSQSRPASTIDGELSLTRGTLEVVTQPGGGLLLVVRADDEKFPDDLEVQFPLAQAALSRGRFGGEQVGEFAEHVESAPLPIPDRDKARHSRQPAGGTAPRD